MEEKRKFRPNPDLKLMYQVKEVLRYHHYALRTEQTYCEWIKRYIQHFNMQSRADLCDGERKVEEYLTLLARDRKVAPSTRNQAMNALVFFYKQVLKQPMTEKINAEPSRRRGGQSGRPLSRRWTRCLCSPQVVREICTCPARDFPMFGKRKARRVGGLVRCGWLAVRSLPARTR
jgi:hypothetical protein